ncbi:rod shape-determining protein RodA [Rhodothermus marinus]|uniref:Cell wall polymerase n=1 Tax=Rhodothermus marinus (strain ATCC 43812 / DSM 4252 / R-10) TaxID=518766 RepID=D0MFK3_RHOM4|nr:rod shape-determining protein RodA [Rhodothermus marinus]ACY47530.1 rod shape-determining protein RodA [Rhodothermus marinus DSM 4252]
MARLARRPDLLLLLLWAALVTAGLVALYSTTHGPAAEFLPPSVRDNFVRQLFWAGLSLMAMGTVLLLPVRFFQSMAYVIYGTTVALLLLTLAVGREINGAKAWLYIGSIGFQTSELAKVGTVLAVARLLSARQARIDTVRYALGAVALILVPAAIIILQNDMGTALVFLALVPVMLYWSGLPVATVLLVISPALAGYLTLVYWPAAVAFAVLFTVGIYWHTREAYMGALAALFTGGTAAVASFALAYVLKPYQLARVLSFTNPEAEAYRKTYGFHLVQSKAAIGSGGLFGKGFMQGTQTQGAYVPEQSTDFIFSVIGEEFGFVGAALVLLLFALLLVRLIRMGTECRHPFGLMVAAGVAGVILVHVFINIGMATGLLPVIGIPLPFLSYGGSSLLANTLMLAVVLNLHMRRDDFSIFV